MIFSKMRKTLFCLRLAAALLLFSLVPIHALDLNELDYFKGRWTVKLRGSDPVISFSWTLQEDLNGAWLAGAVTRNGNKISNDFWRVRGAKIERMAFTADRLFVKVESPGWKADKLIFEGTANGASGEMKIRETITKIDKNQFTALWEIQETGGKWRTLSDELCTRELR